MKFFSNKNTSWLLLISGLVLLLEISAGFLLYFLKEKATGAEQPTATAQSLSLVLGAFTPPDIPINLQLRGPLQQEQETRRPEPMKLSLEGISAKAILAYDAQTAEILAEKNSQLQLPIASLTKLLTAWVVYQHGNLNDIVETKTAAGIDVKPVLNLQVDDKVKVLDLFNAMLVGSCNDAAEILADYTALKTSQNFVELMNQAARDLGMSDSRFSNPLGFDYKANYSTAADLQKLVDATQNLAAFTHLGRVLGYQFTGELGRRYFVQATNKLLANHPELQAIKTGYTENAGGSIIIKVTAGGRQIILIVLASDNRETDTLKLEQALKDSLATSANLAK